LAAHRRRRRRALLRVVGLSEEGAVDALEREPPHELVHGAGAFGFHFEFVERSDFSGQLIFESLPLEESLVLRRVQQIGGGEAQDGRARLVGIVDAYLERALADFPGLLAFKRPFLVDDVGELSLGAEFDEYVRECSVIGALGFRGDDVVLEAREARFSPPRKGWRNSAAIRPPSALLRGRLAARRDISISVP
jgi:hypothetical protein